MPCCSWYAARCARPTASDWAEVGGSRWRVWCKQGMYFAAGCSSNSPSLYPNKQLHLLRLQMLTTTGSWGTRRECVSVYSHSNLNACLQLRDSCPFPRTTSHHCSRLHPLNALPPIQMQDMLHSAGASCSLAIRFRYLRLVVVAIEHMQLTKDFPCASLDAIHKLIDLSA